MSSKKVPNQPDINVSDIELAKENASKKQEPSIEEAKDQLIKSEQQKKPEIEENIHEKNLSIQDINLNEMEEGVPQRIISADLNKEQTPSHKNVFPSQNIKSLIHLDFVEEKKAGDDPKSQKNPFSSSQALLGQESSKENLIKTTDNFKEIELKKFSPTKEKEKEGESIETSKHQDSSFKNTEKKKNEKYLKFLNLALVCLFLIQAAILPVLLVSFPITEIDKLNPLLEIAKKDESFETVTANMTAEEKELILKPAKDQALNNKTDIITIWYPKNEMHAYRIELTKDGHISSNENNRTNANKTKNVYNTSGSDQMKQKNFYTIQFITTGTTNNYVTLFLLVNEGNKTQNLSELIANKTNLNESETDNDNDNDTDTTVLNGTSNKTNKMQLNLTICNASKTGKVIDCMKPTSMSLSLFQISMNSLDQFLPQLNKTFMNIYSVKASNSTRRILSEGEKVQNKSSNDKVEGVYGNDYTKEHNLVIEDNGENSTMEMNTKYEQNELGGDLNLSTETQELKVEKNTQMDPNTAVTKNSEMEGKLNITAQKNLTVDGILLKDEDYLCDSFTTNFSVKIFQIEKPVTLEDEKIKFLNNLSSLIIYEQILDPINNNTIYRNTNDTDNEDLKNYDETRLLFNFNEILFQHRQNIFKTNILGINIYGYILIICYEDDSCTAFGKVDLGGIFTITLYQSTMAKVGISSVVRQYKVIQWRALTVIDGITNIVKNVDSQVKKDYDSFKESNENLINGFKPSINQVIDKYSNIFDVMSEKFGTNSDFINVIIGLIQNEYYTYFKDQSSNLENKYLAIQFNIWKFNSTINQLKCSIKKNEKYNDAIKMIPNIKAAFLDYYSNIISNYTFNFVEGKFKKIQNKVKEICEVEINKISNPSLADIIRSFISKKIDPFFNEWNDLLDQQFIDGKVKLNINYIKNEEILNETLTEYEQYFETEEQELICEENVSNETMSVLLSETEIKDLFTISSFLVSTERMKSEASPIMIDSLNSTISKGVIDMVVAINATVLESKNTFSEVFNFTKKTFSESIKNIDSLVSSAQSTFLNNINQNYGSLKSQANEIKRLFNSVFNSNYKPTDDDLNNMDSNIFNIKDVIEKIFQKFSDIIKAFKKTFNNYQNLFGSRILLEKYPNSSAKPTRVLSSLTNNIFDNFFTNVNDKFNELNQTYISSKDSVKEMANSFGQELNLDDDDFGSFKNDFEGLFVKAEQIFDTVSNDDFIGNGMALIQNHLEDIFDLKFNLIDILKSLLPAKEILIWQLPKNLQGKEVYVTLLSIPILIGVAKLDIFFGTYVNLEVFLGVTSEGYIYLKVVPQASVYTGVRAYAEILVIKMGVEWRVVLFDGRLEIVLGFNFLRFKFMLKIDIFIEALSFLIKFIMSFLYPTIKWYCFKIWLIFFSFKICFPFIGFEWTRWKTLYEVKFTLFSYQSTLVNKVLG